MLIQEKELAAVINELATLKDEANNSVQIKLITQIQSYCATNLYVSTAQKDLIKKRNDLLNYMQSGEVTLTCKESEIATYKRKLSQAFNLGLKIIEGVELILKRPKLPHIDSHCNSSIALAYSFTLRAEQDPERTHGSTSNFDLYVVNGAQDKEFVFDINFGMATLNVLKREIATLETFESLDLHKTADKLGA